MPIVCVYNILLLTKLYSFCHKKSAYMYKLTSLISLAAVITLISVGCITVNTQPETPESTPAAIPEISPSPSPVLAPTITPTPSPVASPTPTIAPSTATVPPPTATPPPSVAPPTTPIPTSAPDHDVVDLVAEAKQSVVRLSKRDNSGSGSGVFFSVREEQRTPYILTNHHVVDGVTEIVILMTDGQTHDGEIIWTDSQRDLAVVRLTCCLQAYQLPVGISLANSIPLDGEEVVAMGFPLGVFTVRSTKGIVASSWYSSNSDRWWIQSDAASNPGSSGGPLMSVDGEVVGIITSSTDYTEGGRPVEGMNYAVSSVTIIRVIPSTAQLSAMALPSPTPAARATPMPTPRPTVRPIASPTVRPTPRPTARSTPSLTPVTPRKIGPINVSITHNPYSGFIDVYDTGIWTRDGSIEASFVNPEPGPDGWSYGFMFRRHDSNYFHAIVLTGTANSYSRGKWLHIVSSGSSESRQTLKQEYLAQINTEQGERNHIWVGFQGGRGTIFINGEPIATQDLGDLMENGRVSLIGVYFTGHARAGGSTDVEDVIVESLGIGAPPPTPGQKPSPTPKPIPTPTARPTPTPPTSELIPVDPRLKVSMPPPGVQATTHWKLAGWQSAQGPLYTIYDTLIHLDRYTEEYVPYLADSWSISNDAKEWTFKLKENIPFYKNKEATQYTMTVEDVIHSFEINYFPPYQSGVPGIAAQSTADRRHFDIKSDYEFVWKLDKPDLTWGYWSSDDRRGVASKAYWDKVGEETYIEDPIGNGPFTFSWFELNHGLIVERVEDHYRKTPEFHELQFFYTREEATRAAMLYTNESDIVSIARSLHEQAKSRGYQVQNSTIPSSYTFMFIGGMFDASRPNGYGEIDPNFVVDEESPMRNALVREALNLAIDRDEMNHVFFNGDAVKTTHWAFPPWWTHGDPSWAPYDYNPNLAKELIAQAGYLNGFKMDVYVPPSIAGLPEISEMAEVIAQYLEQIGLEVELIRINIAQMTSMARNREYSRGVVQNRFGPPGRGQLVRHFENNISWRQEWQMHQEIYDFVERLESARSWSKLEAIEMEAANWARDNHLIIPLFWLFGQVVINPAVVQSYESRHLHMGPSRHHEYTVPVYR